MLQYFCAYARAFCDFSFSSITSITNHVNVFVIRLLGSDRRVIEGVIEVIEERLINYKTNDISHKFTIK